jgi:hypothetical protein
MLKSRPHKGKVNLSIAKNGAVFVFVIVDNYLFILTVFIQKVEKFMLPEDRILYF